MKKFFLSLTILLLAGILLAGCAQPTTNDNTIPPASTTSAPQADNAAASATVESTSAPTTNTNAAIDGKTLLETRCVSCHTLAKVASQHGDAAFWQKIVSNMISKGAQLNADEQQVLVDYLAANFQ